MEDENLKTAAVSLGWEPSGPSVFDQPMELGNRYVLRRILAEGGLGQVWLAYDKELQRDVALKQVLAKWADRANIVEQLRLEAIITGRLEHPGIVPVHDVGRDRDHQLYYCMKLVQGRTLREEFCYLGEEPGTDRGVEKRRRIYGAYMAICDAIAYAHSRGVVHLDLKPENVILGDYGETQVLDWGLARLLSSEWDTPSDGRARGPIGTPRYMSPEQITGSVGDFKPTSDIYALGVMLAEIALLEQGHMLPPVERDTLEQTPEKNRACVRRHLRGPLRSICLKAMAQKPAERYQDARELAAEVQRYVSGDKVLVHREGAVTNCVGWDARTRPSSLLTPWWRLSSRASLARSMISATRERSSPRCR
ncbi:MAG: serine/threonine-protein kinase [Planctomycetota bacterium]